MKPTMQGCGRFLALAGAALTLCVPSAALPQAKSDEWRFAITPYLWLPNVNAKLKYNVPPGGGSPEVGVGPNDYLSNLDMALMLSGEVRKGRWAVFTDFIYLDFSGERSQVNAVNFVSVGRDRVTSQIDTGTQSDIKGAVWTLAASYTAIDEPRGSLDVFGGFRLLDLEASSNWQLTTDIMGPNTGLVFPRSGSVSQKEDIWDAIIGVRGRVRLGSGAWSMPYYVDVGTGDSQLTWQGLIGVAYGFHWGEVTLAYRYLYYDQGSDKLVQRMDFGGPALGVTFRF